MLSGKDIAIVYETLLSSPGMNETVKISLSIHRKKILLLTRIIDLGLSVKDDSGSLFFGLAGKDIASDFMEITAELLQKAGLTEMNDKLNSLQVK